MATLSQQQETNVVTEDGRPLKRWKTVPGATAPVINTQGVISSVEADNIRSNFEKKLPGYLTEFERFFERPLTSKELYNLYEYIFIGRVSPPHSGHFASIFSMIDQARVNENNSKVIILAGSGPALKGSEAAQAFITLNNPIPFEKKAAIIIQILKMKYGEAYVEQNVTIQKMQSAPGQIVAIIKEELPISGDIHAKLVVGAKGNDITKLSFIGPAVIKGVSEAGHLNIDFDILPVVAAPSADGSKAASATQVRIDAFSSNREEFIAKYFPSYHALFEVLLLTEVHLDEIVMEIVGQIYDDIHIGVSGIRRDFIQEYINSKGERVTAAKKKGTEAANLGGSRRRTRKTKGRKNRKTKRRRTRTRTRRTKRRRSRRN